MTNTKLRLNAAAVQPFAHNAELPPIGIVAGWGKFPVEVAQQIKSEGRRVCCIAITGHANGELADVCDSIKWLGVGKLGGHIRYFGRQGVQQVTMAGKLFKAQILFKGSVILQHFPDWCAIRTFGPHLFGRRRDSRDDSLLMAVTRAYSSGGLEVCPATDFASELLVKQGILVGKQPNAKVWADVQSGWRIARQMGGLDIGQTITIKDGTVIAVEAIEGTDACIERTGELCRRGGWTLVKVSKPNQDMRFDVPTIGPQTVQRVKDAGGTAIAIEADMTIMVERETTLALAKRLGVTIVALSEAEVAKARIAA